MQLQCSNIVIMQLLDILARLKFNGDRIKIK